MDYEKEHPYASLIIHPSANPDSKRSSRLERAEGPELARMRLQVQQLMSPPARRHLSLTLICLSASSDMPPSEGTPTLRNGWSGSAAIANPYLTLQPPKIRRSRAKDLAELTRELALVGIARGERNLRDREIGAS